MKILKFLTAFLLVFFANSCVTDSKEDATQDMDSTATEVETPDNTIKPDTTQIAEPKKDSVATKLDKAKPKLTAEQIKLAQDIDKMIHDKVNKNPNPDNYNGQIDDKNGSSYGFNIVPVINDEDMGFYYLQFFESPSKLSKDALRKYRITEDIYVVSHEGVFKYCITKSKTEAESKALKAKIAKKYKLKNLTVETFGEAF